MYHGVKKVKIRGGVDANVALTRKLLKNFLEHGSITSTHAKIKVLKTLVDKFVSLGKRTTPGAYQKMLSLLPSKKHVDLVKEVVVPQVDNKTGGYVRIIKHLQRLNDGAYMSTLEWAQSVTLAKKKEDKEEKQEVQKETDKTVKEKKVSKAKAK